MKIAFAAASLLAASLAGAHASEPYAADKGDANWSGPYIGAHVGYGWQSSSNTWRSPGAGFFTWQPDGDIDSRSVIGGGYVGYQRQVGRIVFGAEADLSLASLEGDDAQFAGLVNSLELNHFGTIRARLGVTYGRSLFFVTGGYAFGQITKADETLGASAKHDVSGWTIGGGYEARLTRAWRGRLEYQYLDFGKAESYFDFGGGAYYLHRVDALSIHVLRAGLAYAF